MFRTGRPLSFRLHRVETELKKLKDWRPQRDSNPCYQRERDATWLRRCGARRKQDGLPCVAKLLANGRCKFHGGMSTGPRTLEGRARSLANLRQNRAVEPHCSIPS
ncbi:MAG TPA: HGGxSTG domain-containing protein [Alphaproteobacteria bacterium]|nr:HGGxSTG domain-containing protein [Alphaproteobacteria bacterium]